MKIFSNRIDAIIDLHKRGFRNDFQLFGNDLLWVQESLVRVGEFAIVRYQKINDLIVCGIIARHYDIKGIFTIEKNISDLSPVLTRSLSN
jgi:hypothetical protein